jgi:hypothetical protein
MTSRRSKNTFDPAGAPANIGAQEPMDLRRAIQIGLPRVSLRKRLSLSLITIGPLFFLAELFWISPQLGFVGGALFAAMGAIIVGLLEHAIRNAVSKDSRHRLEK